jgi:hypothetical protein
MTPRFLALCAFELVCLVATIAGSFAIAGMLHAAFAPTIHTLSQVTP